VIGDRTSEIVKGPSLLGANLGFATFRFRFRASNHTFSPFLKGVKRLLVLAAMVCRASSCAARASRRAAWRAFKRSSTAGSEEVGRTLGSGTGSYPIIRKNGDFPVTECGRWL
jgi:hypothetical protein